ncbi:MAG: hypothetical protein KF704_08390 [Crocinitomicaceae bacterium]|nr:hypothetical protein [Crocinitomicaceae bacterium]
MKKLITFIGLIILSFSLKGQKDFNPFESIGKEGKMLTLSDGKYIEVEMYDSLQRIGSAIINRNTGEIHELLPIDDTSEFRYDPTTFSRWYSVDPVVKAHESPYAGFSNNPIWFIDPNGADTAHYQSTINEAKFTSAMQSVNKSSTFTNFFQSFVNGANSDIKLDFQAVKDLRAFDAPETELNGQVLLMYKGKHITDVSNVPTNASISDFSVLVQLRSGISYSAEKGGGDYANAVKGVTMVHEMFVHAITATSLIRNATNADGTIDGSALQSSYIGTMAEDHSTLYAGKNKNFMTVANEVVAAQSSLHSQYYQVVGTNPIETQAGLPAMEKQHGKLKTIQNGNTSLAYFSYKQLWRFVFNDNMTPMPSLQKTK